MKVQQGDFLKSEKRSNGRLTAIRYREIHTQILRFLAQAGWARDVQVAGWLDASVPTIRKALIELRNLGLTKSQRTYAKLRTFESGDVRERAVTVWAITSKASNEKYLGSWEVAGYTEELYSAPPGELSNLKMVDHRLCVNDVAVLYARFGFQVAFEAEMKRLDGIGFTASKRLEKVWAAGKIPHFPDLGLISPNSPIRWGVEIERKLGTVESYEVVIQKFLDSQMGQLWFCQRETVTKAILRACENRGIILREYTYPYGNVWISENGLVRIMRYPCGVEALDKYLDKSSRYGIFWEVVAGLPVRCSSISPDGKLSTWEVTGGSIPLLGFPGELKLQERRQLWQMRSQNKHP